MKDVLSLTYEIIEGNGYVLISDVLSPTQAEEARSMVLTDLD